MSANLHREANRNTALGHVTLVFGERERGGEYWPLVPMSRPVPPRESEFGCISSHARIWTEGVLAPLSTRLR